MWSANTWNFVDWVPEYVGKIYPNNYIGQTNLHVGYIVHVIVFSECPKLLQSDEQQVTREKLEGYFT